MNDSANSSRVESESTPVSAPFATSPPTAAQSSTNKASQRVNTEPNTRTAEVKLREPKSGRPDFVTEELAAQRAEDLKKSMWATQTSATTKSVSGKTSASCKAAQIFKSCIDDAKGNEGGKDLQNSRRASVTSEAKKPVGITVSPLPQTVPLTTQSGKTTTSAVAVSKAMPPASPSIAVKPSSSADPAPVAPTSATLSPAAANPVSASITEASAVTAKTATAPSMVASVSVAVPVRASQYSSSAHAAAARSSDIPQRGRGTGIGSGRAIGRGGRGRGAGGRGRGTGRGVMQNHEVPDWLAEDLARQAAEAQSSAMTPQYAPSTANHPPTAVAAASPAPLGPSQTNSQRSVSSKSSRLSPKLRSKNELSESRWATSADSATLSKPAPEPTVMNGLLQSRYAGDDDNDSDPKIRVKTKSKAELADSIRAAASHPVTSSPPKPKINHQLADSKWATDGNSTKSTIAAPKLKAKNDLLQSKYAT